MILFLLMGVRGGIVSFFKGGNAFIGVQIGIGMPPKW